jgi:hypothetical protein
VLPGEGLAPFIFCGKNDNGKPPWLNRIKLEPQKIIETSRGGWNVAILQTTVKKRIIKCALVALILGFFLIPLVAFFGNYYQPGSPKHIASILFNFRR